jgi:hypothetical protein
MAVAIAVDATDLNTQPAIPQQAIDNFMNGVLSIGHSMTRSWEDTLMYSQLAVSYLTAMLQHHKFSQKEASINSFLEVISIGIPEGVYG